jgi:AbiV family abortive infection protein
MKKSSSKRIFGNACRKSLENAKQLLADAKLLIRNRSYGHAIALAIFSDEELAKALSCWLAAKGLIPEESKAIDDAFSSHHMKHLAQIGIYVGMRLQEGLRQGRTTLVDILKEGMKLTEVQIAKDMEKIQRMAEERESLRQDAVYVDITVDGKSLSPSDFTRDEAEEAISGVDQRLSYEERLITNPSHEELLSFRAYFDSLPKDAIMRNEIPIDWFTSWKRKKST